MTPENRRESKQGGVAARASAFSIAMGIDDRTQLKDCPAIVGSTDHFEKFSGFTTPTGFRLTSLEIIDPDIVFSHADTPGEDILVLQVTDFVRCL